MKSKKKSISVSLDDDIVEKLRVLAENDDRKLSSYINIILRDYLIARTQENTPEEIPPK